MAGARSAIAAAGLAPDQEPGGLDDHQALEYMRRILDQLAGEQPATKPLTGLVLIKAYHINLNKDGTFGVAPGGQAQKSGYSRQGLRVDAPGR